MDRPSPLPGWCEPARRTKHAYAAHFQLAWRRRDVELQRQSELGAGSAPAGALLSQQVGPVAWRQRQLRLALRIEPDEGQQLVRRTRPNSQLIDAVRGF